MGKACCVSCGALPSAGSTVQDIIATSPVTSSRPQAQATGELGACKMLRTVGQLEYHVCTLQEPEKTQSSLATMLRAFSHAHTHTH
jgi:hypothetical protein